MLPRYLGHAVNLDRCPKGCGTPTQPQRGHPTLCLACTEAEIGTTIAQLRATVTERLQKNRKRKWSMHSTGARERGVTQT